MRQTLSIFSHTNIVSRDWRRLAGFYESVFNCKRLRPRRRLGGKSIAKGTGLKAAQLEGVHMALPGFAAGGPTLEIFQYEAVVNKAETMPNTQGFSHIAFEVDDVAKVQAKALRYGGTALGQVSSKAIRGVGTVTFVYIRDPDGNIIEVQSWVRRSRAGKAHRSLEKSP
jgi:predicted enzyme related to lactoylglutathione lyase